MRYLDNRFILGRMLLITERWGDRTWVEKRIPVEKWMCTNRRVIKREELVGERNRREDKKAISVCWNARVRRRKDQGFLLSELCFHRTLANEKRASGWKPLSVLWASWLPIIENLHFQFQPKANRGDSTRSKKECLKLNVPTAVTLPWCLSSLQ